VEPMARHKKADDTTTKAAERSSTTTVRKWPANTCDNVGTAAAPPKVAATQSWWEAMKSCTTVSAADRPTPVSAKCAHLICATRARRGAAG